MRKVRYEIARIEDIPPDIGRIYALGSGGECAVFFHQGRYFSMGSLCPHQNASLQDAPAQDGTIVCRRHGYRFDLKSGECLTVGGYGLPVFETAVENGILYVSTWEYD